MNLRLRNFCVQMGYALFVGLILFVLLYKMPLHIRIAPGALYVAFHLIWAFFSDRQTVYGQKSQVLLAEKYPDVPKPDTEYTVDGKTAILKDAFIKSALLNTIFLPDYYAKKKRDREILETFYSSVKAGNYTLHQYVISKKEWEQGNDCADSYYIHCNERRWEIIKSIYSKCNVGDQVVEVSVAGMPVSSLLIWLDPAGVQHPVAWQNNFYQIKNHKGVF